MEVNGQLHARAALPLNALKRETFLPLSVIQLEFFGGSDGSIVAVSTIWCNYKDFNNYYMSYLAFHTKICAYEAPSVRR